MNLLFGRFWFFLLLFGWSASHVFSQNTDSLSNKKDTTYVRPYTIDYQLEFPNINRVSFYYDAGKWKKIEKAREKNDLQLELKLLRNYVQHFGIENFKKQNSLVWRLGQLEEYVGNKSEAIAVYRIAIHHHPNNIDKIKNHYDSLVIGERISYVSIEKYFEMAEMRRKIDTLYPPRNVYANMGKSLNSDYDDYGPSMSLSNNLLFFTSKRNIDALGRVNEDIYMAKFSGGWKPAKPVGVPINSNDNDGSPFLTYDGKYLYFARCNCVRCYGDCDIFYAERLTDSTWGKVENLGEAVNSPYWDSHPSLSAGGDTLFFSSDRPGGFGSADIWFSVKDENGTWQPAKNLGPVVNTRSTEVSPFYHPKYKVLYFSSNAGGRLTTFGGFDIYRSHYMHSKWREPKNVGPLINGKGDEYYFTIDTESKKIYYAHSDEKNKDGLELFSYPLPMGANPLAVTRLEGLVQDEGENPFKGVISIIDLDNQVEVAPINIRDDGSYEFDLVDENNYLMVVHGEDFFRLEQQFRLDGDTRMDIKIPRINVNKFVFENLEFDAGSSEILDSMHADLNKILEFLIDNPFYYLIITGHTDSHGDKQANKDLSQARADAIKLWLIDNSYMQVSEERIKAIGMGSDKPLVEEKNEHDREVNRRVEFEILTEDKADWLQKDLGW